MTAAIQADPAPVELVAGALVDGRYRLVRYLARGTTAQVWRARDERLGRTVALKVFDGDLLDRDAHRTEIATLARLSHVGLVAMYDAGTFSDPAGRVWSFVSFEFVGGGTLRDMLADGPLDIATTAAIGADIATALDHVHAHGVVHRDVKPANILLTDSASGGPVRAKLADFGVAKSAYSQQHTAAGLIVGTANYLSPEQVRGEGTDERTDIYALGLVLIEALTGRSPYQGSGMEVALARLHRPPAVPAHLPASWRALLTAMVADKPQWRPTAAVVARRLTELACAPEPPEEPISPAWSGRGVRPAVLDDGSAALAVETSSWFDAFVDDDAEPPVPDVVRRRARHRRRSSLLRFR